MGKLKVTPGLYLIRVDSKGKMTLWHCKDASDTGYILIDMVSNHIHFNYTPKKEVDNEA